MPIYLRNFYYKKLIEAKKSETEQIEKVEFPTFSDIGKQTSKKKNLGRPTRYSKQRQGKEEPINEEQLQNLKERLTQRAKGERMMRPSTQSKLKSVSVRDITEQKED